MKVIEHVAGHYDVQEVEFGRVYKWRPEHVVIECDCGERLTLTGSTSTCEECGEDYTALVRKNQDVRRREGDGIVRPWRSWHSSEDTGLPF